MRQFASEVDNDAAMEAANTAVDDLACALAEELRCSGANALMLILVAACVGLAGAQGRRAPLVSRWLRALADQGQDPQNKRAIARVQRAGNVLLESSEAHAQGGGTT